MGATIDQVDELELTIETANDEKPIQAFLEAIQNCWRRSSEDPIGMSLASPGSATSTYRLRRCDADSNGVRWECLSRLKRLDLRQRSVAEPSGETRTDRARSDPGLAYVARTQPAQGPIPAVGRRTWSVRHQSSMLICYLSSSDAAPPERERQCGLGQTIAVESRGGHDLRPFPQQAPCCHHVRAPAANAALFQRDARLQPDLEFPPTESAATEEIRGDDARSRGWVGPAAGLPRTGDWRLQRRGHDAGNRDR